MRNYLPYVLVIVAAFVLGAAFVESFHRPQDGVGIRVEIAVCLVLALILTACNWWSDNRQHVLDGYWHYRNRRASHEEYVTRLRAEALIRKQDAELFGNENHTIPATPAW